MSRKSSIRWFPLLALPAGVVLLQWHGTQFWSELTGSDAWGWGASLTLEWIALWAWAREARAEARAEGWQTVFGPAGSWLLFAGACTALLIAGPLYQVGSPLLAEAQEQIVTVNRVARADAALDVLKRESMEGESRTRGIVALTREDSAALRALRQANADARRVTRAIEKFTTSANADEASLFGADARGHRGMGRVLASGHLLILCVFSIGTVLAIRELAGASPWVYDERAIPIEEQIEKIVAETGLGNGNGHQETAETPPKPEKPLPVERVRAVYRRIMGAGLGNSTQQVADALTAALPDGTGGTITKKLIWQLGHHADLLAAGEPTAGPAQLARVEEALWAIEGRTAKAVSLDSAIAPAANRDPLSWMK